MDNGIYLALSRQMALFDDMDITANNLANANTTGYGAEHVLFNNFLVADNNSGDRTKLAFANEAGSYRNLDNGSLTSTGNQLDVAIQGNGYLVVETPLGKRYTRAGNMQINSDGVLTTQEGYPILDSSSNQISVPENTISVEVGEGGNLKFNGIDNGALNVVEFPNPQLLERVTGRLYKSDITPYPATNARVAQGMLESSNVEPVKELTHMTTLTHSVADTAQYIAIVFDLEIKADTAWSQQ